MQPHQRGECLLDHPCQARIRQVPPRLGDRRHVMDDVPERRSLDEQDVSHIALVAPIYPRLSIVATSNCEITGLSHPPPSLAAIINGACSCRRPGIRSGSGPGQAFAGTCASRDAPTMTILVTGGAGYIGSHMVHALVDAGERVVVLPNLLHGFGGERAPQG